MCSRQSPNEVHVDEDTPGPEAGLWGELGAHHEQPRLPDQLSLARQRVRGREGVTTPHPGTPQGVLPLHLAHPVGPTTVGLSGQYTRTSQIVTTVHAHLQVPVLFLCICCFSMNKAVESLSAS